MVCWETFHSPPWGGQPCLVAFASFHGYKCSHNGQFQVTHKTPPKRAGKRCTTRPQGEPASHTLPHGVLGTEMWGFLDIAVCGNNRRECFESGLSENQGPVATHVSLPSHHIQPAVLKALSPSLCSGWTHILYPHPAMPSHLFITCVLVLHPGHAAPGGTICTASCGSTSPPRPLPWSEVPTISCLTAPWPPSGLLLPFLPSSL